MPLFTSADEGMFAESDVTVIEPTSRAYSIMGGAAGDVPTEYPPPDSIIPMPVGTILYDGPDIAKKEIIAQSASNTVSNDGRGHAACDELVFIEKY